MTLATQKVRLLLELRQGGITDTKLLAAMERVPRELFVPDTFRDRSYDSTALPIGHGQTISQPLIVARMVEALDINDRTKVLEIGTGSGYLTAILSYLCRRVYTIEMHRDLLLSAESMIQGLRRTNVTTKFGDGTKGWAEQAPFERIIASAAAPEIPVNLFNQLAEGGIMIIPIGDPRREQQLMRVTKRDGMVVTDELGAVRFLPLVPGGIQGERAV